MKKKYVLPAAVFIAGLCSIIYELLISTTATYFLGDGVRQFSIIIGVYLFSMGLGAYVSRFFKKKPLSFFINLEFALGLIGGLSVPMLYLLFVEVSSTTLQILTLCIIFFIGLLTGMEVPLLTYAGDQDNIKDRLSEILSLDYIGGLIATLIFPFLLLPFVGLFYSSLAFGLLNIALGIFLAVYFKKGLKTIIPGIVSAIILIGLAVYGGNLLKIWDEKIYKAPIVYNEQTPFQKIVLTKRYDDVRLYLNRVIQFSSSDEYRYHEALIHVPLSFHENPQRVLVLGGGENLASRELLKDKRVREIDVVDIDSAMFDIARNNAYIKKINEGAALDSRVNLIPSDAFIHLKENNRKYDVIIADLPDPTSESVARLYSKQFFLLAKRNLADNGVFCTQSGEIYYSNSVFSCINNTLADVFPHNKPYHVNVPSFGDWGFVLSTEKPVQAGQDYQLPENLKYFDDFQLQQSLRLPRDVKIASTEINTLDSPIILEYLLRDYEKWKSLFGGDLK